MQSITKHILAVVALALVFIAFPAESFAQARPYDLAQLDTRVAAETARAAAIRGVAAAARAFDSGAAR